MGFVDSENPSQVLLEIGRLAMGKQNPTWRIDRDGYRKRRYCMDCERTGYDPDDDDDDYGYGDDVDDDDDPEDDDDFDE